MRAWTVGQPGPIDTDPLRLRELPDPTAGAGEIRVRVSVCGVCRTDLHLAEGDLPARRRDVVPGHEVVGVIDQLGPGCSRFDLGERVGVPWLAWTCGTCRFCVSDRENLCLSPRFTGWDADGGYAEYTVVDERYAYRLPETLGDEETAPLLCAGIIGYRALRRSGARPGGSLGIYGFGGSAHLTAQIAIAEGCRVHVFTRSEAARRLALDLGATSAGETGTTSPEPLGAAVLFAPVGSLVPVALAALDRGATLAIAGIHLREIPSLDYDRHLFEERSVCSVTANTRRDGEEFLAAAISARVVATTVVYPFDEAARALSDLAHDRVNGAAVIDLRAAGRP